MKQAFDCWIDYHSKAYPAFAKWVAENDGQVRFMRRLLEAYSVEQLQEATDKLYASDEQPRGYGEHARKIRQFVIEAGGTSQQDERHGPRVLDDHLVADCWRCMDSGLVSVLSPKTLASIRGRDSSQGLLTCTVACDCSRGGHMSRRMRRVPRFEERRCLIRYEDVVDEASATRRDMWDVASDMVAASDQQLSPHAVELSAEVLP